MFFFSCSGMFRNVPACSGMFHVPDFIDGPQKNLQLNPYYRHYEVVTSELKNLEGS